MKKKVNGKIRQVRQDSVVMEVPIPMAEILAGAGFVIEKMAEELGLMLMFAAMYSEAEKLAGQKNRKDPNRKIYWWGQQSGYVYYEGKKVPVYRPRLREKGGNEVKLKSYEAFKSGERAEGLCMADLLSGLSTRNYEWVAGRFLEGYGIKKSTVSRRYIRATKKKMQELLERDLSGLDLCVIFIDGIEIKGHLIVVALGVDMDGQKHVLGLWQGATENIEVCLGLLDDLERRGLNMDREYLFVIDGSKALRSGIRRKFGKRGLVQRCQVHKRRNVKGYLPAEYQGSVDARIRAAYNMSRYEEAKESLQRTVRYLERLNPSAARSLKEGLEETLTVHKLGIGEALRKSLSSTNVIESCFSVTRWVQMRVKRYRNGEMVQRWAAVSLLEAEKRFRRINGYKEIPKLVAALRKQVITEELTEAEEAA